METVISEILYLKETTEMSLEAILNTVLSRYNIEPKKNELITTDATWLPVLDTYLKRMVIRGLSKGSIKQYRFILSSAFETIGKPIEDITSMDIEKYLSYQRNIRKTSLRYIDNVRVILNGFFVYCTKSRIIEKSPMDAVDRIKVPVRKIKPFTEEEMERLRNACAETRDSIRNRAIIELFYSSGLRCSEVVDLNIDDVDLQKKSGMVYNGKGSKMREFYFSDIASYYIRNYLDQRNDKNPALFLSKGANRFSGTGGIEALVSKLGVLGNVPNAKPHRLRHTFIQMCIDKGMGVQDVMLLVGHNNIETTMIYYESNTRHAKEVHERLFN